MFQVTSQHTVYHLACVETCANHPDQYYTLACQQCQLPVCVLCIEISEHKNHSFISLNVMLQDKLSWINNEIKRGHTFEEQMELEKKHFSKTDERYRDKNESKTPISKR